MKRIVQRATKRRIPKVPGKSKCIYRFEVDGELVQMKVDCLGSCMGKRMPKDICWSNLVKAISGSALPDRIILSGRGIVVCDRVLVSLIRNASLLVRRIGNRLDELRRKGLSEDSIEIRRLTDLMRAILYDIPQLISRDFGCTSSDLHDKGDESSSAVEVLAKKSITSFAALNHNLSDRVSD